MSANEDLHEGKVRYFAPEHGKVVDNVDPEGSYRVRVAIDGIVEKSQWAWPIGTQGGGSKQRGAWVVPKIGADVVVFFLGGDLERPTYMCGWWGVTKEGPEMPTETAELSPADVAQLQTVHESDRIKIWVDERPGKEQLAIQDKKVEESFIQINLAEGEIKISAFASLKILAVGAITITGSQVTIQDRIVLPDSKAI